MILPLRRRHRRIFAVIGILLPVAFVAGVVARKPIPTPALPNPLPSAQETFSITQWERLDLFPNMAVRVQLLREAPNTNHIAIQMSAPKDFVKADLLVYWLRANSTLKDNIPDDAVLLGPFVSGQPLPVPPALTGKPGSLVLYSLADQEFVGTSQQLSLK
jgi:hypothetical protein